jgi:hypothetical protein
VLWVEAPGFRSEVARDVPLLLGSHRSVSLDVRLERGGVVEGRVVDLEREPIEGATVLAYDLGKGFQLHEAFTGPDGAFHFGKLCARDEVEIRATLDPSLDPTGEPPIVVAIGTRDLEITLDRRPPSQGTSENSPP